MQCAVVSIPCALTFFEPHEPPERVMETAMTMACIFCACVRTSEARAVKTSYIHPALGAQP